MGIDIRGWVEVGILWEQEQRTSWYGAIKIDHLIDRHTDMFYALFGQGMLPRVKFPPVALNRGTPIDASREVREMVTSDLPDFHGHSWLTWQELLAIDWEEAAELWEGAYIAPPEGTGPFRLARLSNPDLRERLQGWTAEERQQWEARGIVTVDGVTYKRQVKRRDIYDTDWEALFSMMEALARRYGQDKVRLVVMFDC